MNTLKFYPKKLRERYIKTALNSGIKITPEKYHNRVILGSIITAMVSSLIFYLIKLSMFYSFLVLLFIYIFFYFRINLMASARIKKMEESFPDVISLMASNLRSGITIDQSFLLSARPEFAPIDAEIIKAGKEIATGKDILYALKNMGKRIDSEKINKTISLISSGIRAGGNIADLLEQTSANLKEKEFIEKRAASNILMYVVFIFFAVGIGGPVLFSLSSVLVEIIINISSKLPEAGTLNMQIPFTFGNAAVSVNFVVYFAIFFMIVSDLISSLVIGAVNKGEEKAGLKYFIPLVTISIGLFFLMRIILTKFLIGAFNYAV